MGVQTENFPLTWFAQSEFNNTYNDLVGRIAMMGKLLQLEGYQLEIVDDIEGRKLYLVNGLPKAFGTGRPLPHAP